MYEVYAHKQAPRNMTESPPSNMSFSSNSNVNQSISLKQTAGIGFALTRVLPAGKQVINTVVKATGNRRVERAVSGANRALSFGGTALALGLPTAVGIEAISVSVDYISGYIQEITDQTNQEYERQKQGVSINKFVGVGERID